MLKDSQRRIEALETELEILAREASIGVDNTAREDEVNALLKEENEITRTSIKLKATFR